MTEAVLAELDRLRGLAHALVHGDEAEDLIQDAAIAALEHPPALDRPVRSWLAAVIRNRWYSQRRAAMRREAREVAVAPATSIDGAEMVERARMLERLASAVVALDEPYRVVVIRRYLDGDSSASIARELGVPAGTVRWRLKVGLDRLRAALDESRPRRQWAALLAFTAKGAPVVKMKMIVLVVIVMILAVVGLGYGLRTTDHGQKPETASAKLAIPPLAVARSPESEAPPALAPAMARAIISDTAAPGGTVTGRVINWSTGEGVDGAELVFAGDAGALTVHARAGGVFDLTPAAPGRFVLLAASAPGFLPYAPEYLHSNVVVATERDHAVRGITVFLFPALDYHGLVIDAAGQPVAGAHVRLAGAPAGEQIIDKVATEWTADAKGQFTFHGPDDAVFEAVHGKQRGWARLDGKVAITKRMTIKIGDAAARDAQITGRVVDGDGKPLADALVSAMPPPMHDDPPHEPAFATTGPDGTFALTGLDHSTYTVLAELDGFAPARGDYAGGTHGLELALTGGESLAGTVQTAAGAPVPSFTLLVFHRDGVNRDLVVTRSVVDARGRFEVHVAHGDYDVYASANGWAPATITAPAPSRDVKLVVSEGTTVRGRVVSNVDGSPVVYARVMREATVGGASAQPANAGTVTRADGSFELTGVPPGALSLHVDADGFDPKIEGPWVAHDGEVLGPYTITLSHLLDGAEPQTELVGIGVALVADHDAIRIDKVYPNSGAAAAGVIAGDRIVAVDGAAVTDLGLDGTIGKIRGPEGTTVTLSLRRGAAVVPVVVARHKLRA